MARRRAEAISIKSADKIDIRTPNCVVCGKAAVLTVPAEGWAKFINGAFVQTAFPAFTADEREMLINGTHPDCFDTMMGEEK